MPQLSRLEKRQLNEGQARRLQMPEEDEEVAQTSSVPYPLNSGTA